MNLKIQMKLNLNLNLRIIIKLADIVKGPRKLGECGLIGNQLLESGLHESGLLVSG
jgi:hypothetical protein